MRPLVIDDAVQARAAQVRAHALIHRESLASLMRRMNRPGECPGNDPNFVIELFDGWKVVYTILDAHEGIQMNEVAQQQAAADRYIAWCFAARPDLTPCCVAGCFACCSEAVYATEAEVAHIVESLTPSQIAEVVSKLHDWLAKTKPLMNQNMPDALAYRRLDAPCVLLKNGLCSVYERRPFSCRTWFALKNPADCDLPRREHQKYADFMPGIVSATGVPVAVNGNVVLDHLGALLAEKLLNLDFATASRQTAEVSKMKIPSL